MAERRTTAQISAIMTRVRSRDTKPEQLLRKALWHRGFRYKTSVRRLPGSPDIVLSAQRLAIFVDGDFWHGNQWIQRGLPSVQDQFKSCTNADYWNRKIKRNQRRDIVTTNALLKAGWRVVRFWESDIRSNLPACVDVVMKSVSEWHPMIDSSLVAEMTVAEFFAGIGLMRLALERQGFSTLFANDIDPKKLQIYEQNFSTDSFLLKDINHLRGDDIPTVTLATASFPCNDLSLAGKWKGLSGQHSGTFWAFTRILREMQSRKPKIVLLENVPGFLNSRDGEDLADAIAELNDIGYSCDLFTLNAASFVPQSRPRLFIIAVDQDESPDARFQLATECTLRPPRIIQFISRYSNLHWSIRRLPEPPAPCPSLALCLEDLPEKSPEWWEPERADYLMSQLSDRHAPIAKAMIAGPRYTYGTIFRRVRRGRSMAELRTDGLAGCLRTPRGGSGRQILLKAGRGKYSVRLLTARECARLQGAPDSFRVDVPLNQALFGFGDAVCVPVVEWILEQYLSPLMRQMLNGKLLGPTSPVFET